MVNRDAKNADMTRTSERQNILWYQEYMMRNVGVIGKYTKTIKV